ncbi:MAG TPA: hypothetical protein VKE51_43320 [Vicinamibacterales bacterium]|nr:hypothetical protein [Vicinamibacterales bacterium]
MTSGVLASWDHVESVLRIGDPLIVFVWRRGRLILLAGTADAFRYYEIAPVALLPRVVDGPFEVM